MSELLKMVEAFESAVAELNGPIGEQFQMVWGGCQQADCGTSSQERDYDGLLLVENQAIEIRCDGGFGDYEAIMCVMFLPINVGTVLPRQEATQLFNVLATLEPGVSLALAPELRPESEIRVIGLKAVVSLNGLNRFSLEDVISRLIASAGCLQGQLCREDGARDYWQEGLHGVGEAIRC